MPIPALQSPYPGAESSVRNHLVRKVMLLERGGKVKVQLKFRGSKSGRPIDDLL